MTMTDQAQSTERPRMVVTSSHEEIDANLFNVQLLRSLGQWAADEENLRQRWGRWNQALWAEVEVDPGSDEIAFFTSQAEFVGVIPDLNVCGTAYCMAGQAVVQQRDHRLIFGNHWDDNKWQADSCIRIEPTGRKSPLGLPIYRDVGAPEPISGAARVVLGLTHAEADHLFDGDNDVEYIQSRINGMCEDRDVPWLFPNTGEALFFSRNSDGDFDPNDDD